MAKYTGNALENKDAILKILNNVRMFLDDEKHWCKGVFYRKGAYCLSGAIESLSKGYKDHSYFARKYIRDELGMEISVYNDLPQTTHDDILELIDKCISKLKDEIHKDRREHCLIEC